MSETKRRAGTMGEMLEVRGPVVVAPFGEALAELGTDGRRSSG